MRYSLLTYVQNLEPKYMKESTIFDEVCANIFDFYDEKIDRFRIGGAWEDIFVLKDNTRASYARIKDIDFSRMPRFCTHVVIDPEWNEIKYRDEPNFFSNYYRQYIESEKDPETVLVVLDCYKEEGRDKVADCILSIAQGRSEAAEELLQSLKDGERLGEYSELIQKFHTELPGKGIAELWAFHCIQIGDWNALKEIQDPFVIIDLFAPACMSDSELKNLKLDEFYTVLSPFLENENSAIRINTTRAICRLGETIHNMTPYIGLLEPRLYDHGKLKWHGQVSAYAANALYYATVSGETRNMAVKILKDHVTDKDQKTAVVCTSAYTRYLADTGDYANIDKLMKDRSKYVRRGAVEGLFKTILSTDDAIERMRKQNKGIPVREIDFPLICKRLVQGLRDENQDVRKTASEALQHAACKKGLSVAPVASALIEILACDDASLLQNVTSALHGSMRQLNSKSMERAMVAFEPLLEHPNKNVRQKAADAFRLASHILEGSINS